MTVGAKIALWVFGIASAGILGFRIVGLAARYLFNRVYVPPSQRPDDTAPATKETYESEWTP